MPVLPVAFCMALGLFSCTQALCAPPSAALPANALPVKAPDWLQKGLPASYVVNGSQAQVKLSGPATVLHWNSLDVGKNASLQFQMLNPTDRVLNKVDGGAINNQTTIDGLLQSNGQVYIYNANGILFGKNAVVDVNSLVATSLRIDDQRFMNGLLSPSALPNLAIDPALQALPGAVAVEADGAGNALQRAALTAAKNGFILLAAPEVRNAGVLTAPDGQVILAAGTRVFLAAPTSNAMRGLLVEVSSEDLNSGRLKQLADLANLTPNATNTSTGQIQVGHGNASMVGLSVKQDGLVTANTSVSLNGSIWLRAADGATKQGNFAAQANVGGQLSLGANSVTAVLVDVEDTATANASPAFKPSEVRLEGQNIRLGGSLDARTGAQVVAPGGQVSVTAKANPTLSANNPNAASIDLEKGSQIDVSGSSAVSTAMASNVLSVQLRGTELADNLVLRNSALRGQTVNVDTRVALANGGINIGNISGYLNQIGKTVGQYTAAGGTITLASEGAVNLSTGSKLNLSGGWLDYQAGYVNTSKLSYGGKLYDVETAPANLPYDGIVNLPDSSANYVPAYRVGMSAGTLSVTAPQVALSGSLLGTVNPGAGQRNLSAADAPLGAQLTLGADTVYSNPMALSQSISLNDSKVSDDHLHLNLKALADQGFTRFKLNTAGSITLDQELNLPTASSLTLRAGGDINLNANLSSAAGKLDALNLQTIRVADGVTIDLAGQWQNDSPTLAAGALAARDALGQIISPFAIKGGNLSLKANQLVLGEQGADLQVRAAAKGVSFDVSGGAWLNDKNKVTAGNAGSITLAAMPGTTTLDGRLQIGAKVGFQGLGLQKGGSLNLTARDVRITTSADATQALESQVLGDLLLTPEFFTSGGFASRAITANGQLRIDPGTQVNVLSHNWLLNANSAQQGSGAMRSVANETTLPLTSGVMATRNPASLTLKALSSGLVPTNQGLGVLTLGEGARIDTDPLGSVTLVADRQVLIDGTVKAPAGTISIQLSGQGDQSTPAKVVLGEISELNVAGTTQRLWVDASGIASGRVMDGGSIQVGNVDAAKSTPGEVQALSGSTMDVSGAATAMPLALRTGSWVAAPEVLASGAGSITISASNSVMLNGELKGRAGNTQARSGTLNVSADGGVRLGEGGGSLVSASQLAAGGMGSLNLQSLNWIELSDGLNLNLSNSLTLSAPVLRTASDGATATLTAPYVKLGNPFSDVPAGVASDGTGQLRVHAATLDITGHSVTQGFGQIALSAAGDIRLVGVPGIDSPSWYLPGGSFQTGHALTLTAQQVYPGSMTRFEIALTGAEAQKTTLSLAAAGGTAVQAMSAGGAVSLSADDIVQGGTLLAPQGRIELHAAQALHFLAGSLTSVAGNGTVPLGVVTNGSDWSYSPGNSQSASFTTDPSAKLSNGYLPLPVKEIVVRSPSVQQDPGAVLDLSGGGKLQAYEFLPGPGGSYDLLSQAQTWAVMPSYNPAVASVDLQSGSAGAAGIKVYLSGSPGLPAGYYTLLPAHYALLPGAFAVQLQTPLNNMRASDNLRNLDGSYTVAGRLVSGTDGRGDVLTSAFRVLNADVVKNSSQFNLYDANLFFSAQAKQLGVASPQLPTDAGQVRFDITQSLLLQGTTKLSSALGRRGQLDVSAPNLEVVSGAGGGSDGDYVRVSADELSAMGADSIVLGAQRVQQLDGMHLQVTSEQIRVNNNALHPLTAPELVLAARDSVDLTASAKVSALGTSQNGTSSWTIDANNGNGDGALVLATNTPHASVTRSLVSLTHGTLSMAQGAQLTASGTLALDATAAMNLAQAPVALVGASLSISAPQLTLGDLPAQAGVPQLDVSTLAGYSKLDELSLTSYRDLNIGANVVVSGLKTLNLAAARVVRQSGDASLQATNLNLKGMGGEAMRDASSGTGVLELKADKIQVGGGTMNIQGFDQVKLTSKTDVMATAAQGEIAVTSGAQLDVTAQRLTTRAGAGLTLSAQGNVQLMAATPSSDVLEAAGLGGTITVLGNTVNVQTLLQAPSGNISLAGAQGVTLAQSARVDVSGQSKVFGSGRAYAPAGTIAIDGGQGDVRIGENAVLDLSAQGADAGHLDVTVRGADSSQFILQGQVLGNASASSAKTDLSPAQGRFSLDVARLDTPGAFDDLNAKLNTSGMSGARTVRVRHGDLGMAGLIKASAVELALDDGNLTVAGTIDASGPKGGSIQLFAAGTALDGKGGVTLTSTAVLKANATSAATTSAGSLGDGGSVLVSTAQRDGGAAAGPGIVGEAGALIDVSGAGAGQDGTVLLRAPRNAQGTDVGVQQFATQVKGQSAIQTVIEAVQVYQAQTISEQADSATNLNTGANGLMHTQASNFMRSAAAIQNRLGRNDVVVTPGIEVQSSGDLTVSVNEQNVDPSLRGWDLSGWRFNGQAGTLSLRAAGNLLIAGAISDGFTPVSGAAMPNWQLSSDAHAWSLRLTGGADLSAANPLSTLASNTTGDVTIGFARRPVDGDIPVALLRTGTGRIDMAAGRDIRLAQVTLPNPDGDTTLDQQFGAAVYTAGVATVLPSNFQAPVNVANATYATGDQGSPAATFGHSGGAISLAAQRDVVGPAVPGLVNNWLFRQGRSILQADGTYAFETVNQGNTTLNTAWWVRPDYFAGGVATFAGGDITVQASRGSVTDLMASTATNAYLPGNKAVSSQLVEQGGGDLQVKAGLDIVGGQFFVQKGSMNLRAQRDVVAGNLRALDLINTLDPDFPVYSPLATVLALGDASAQVVAGRGLAIEAIYNPTLARQSVYNVNGQVDPNTGQFLLVDASTDAYRSQYAQLSSFSTYGANSAVRLTAMGGNAVLSNNGLLLANLSSSLPSYDAPGQIYNPLYVYAPATLRMTSLAADVRVDEGLGMAPSANGQLELLAHNNIVLSSYGPLYNGVVMLDADPSSLAQAAAPKGMSSSDVGLLLGKLNNSLSGHTPGNLHANDKDPVRIVALLGDIASASPSDPSVQLPGTMLALPKAAEIQAGRDVRDLGFSIQNNTATDKTSVQAGRDVIDTTNPNAPTDVKHVVTGSGSLVIVAGRDIDLGDSAGVVTRGNLDNPYLPKGGADVMAIAGAGLPTSLADLTPAQRAADQASFFFQLVDASKQSTLTRFDTLINGQYPTSPDSEGSIKVFASQIKTEQNGNMDLIAPHGSVIAGLTSIPYYLQGKSAADNGLFTVRGGAIRVLVGNDFIVNQGRVFTLGGGDVTMISQNGNIDAGRGSKTASSAPPPLLTTDENGNTKIDISGSISGSGIATLSTSPNQPASNVVAVAPRGIFDAGDAGVRATGAVAIQALAVLNGGNISASGGISSSAPIAAPSAAAPAPASSTPVAQDASKQVLSPSEGLGLSVELLGYGDETADDEKRRKRN